MEIKKIDVFKMKNRVILVKAGPGTPIAALDSPCNTIELSQGLKELIAKVYFDTFKLKDKTVDDVQFIDWVKGDEEYCRIVE